MEGGKDRSPGLLVVLIILIVGVIAGLGISFGGAVAVKSTSGKEFCGQCHTMDPMIASYEHDVHGGAAKHGMEVKCVDCHLPHDSMKNYLVEKVRTGLKDVYVQNFTDTSTIDWQERRKHKESYVFDSACLNCHVDLQESSLSNLKAINAHRDYFGKRTEKKCVSCHENVGHKDLGLYLSKGTNNFKKEN